MSAADSQYDLDTARAKTPAERLRIVADLYEANDRGEQVFVMDGERFVGAVSVHDIVVLSRTRYVTKRRPVLVIPALELFEGPIIERPSYGDMYYRAEMLPSDNEPWKWCGNSRDEAHFVSCLCFRTASAADCAAKHIRDALAKAVKS